MYKEEILKEEVAVIVERQVNILRAHIRSLTMQRKQLLTLYLQRLKHILILRKKLQQQQKLIRITILQQRKLTSLYILTTKLQITTMQLVTIQQSI
jgi:hypothetical protein